MGEKPTDDIEQPATGRLVAGSAAAGAAGSAATRASLPESPPVAAAGAVADNGHDVEEEEPAAEQPVRFAYVCYHCGAHREVDSEGYVSDCSTCGQTLASGRAQMEAVARGDHVPTYDRTSSFYP